MKRIFYFLFFNSLFLLLVSPINATETTVYLGSIEKNIETGEVKVYIPAGNATVMKVKNQVRYLYSDHLGSTSLVTDEQGNKTESYLYYPFGEITNYQFLITNQNQNSNFKTDKLYTGQRRDSSSDLYFYNARYYNPNTSNFISADKAQGPNRYSYAGNNPLMRNDPSGNEPIIGVSGVYGGTMGFGVGSGGINYLPDDYISRDEQIASATMLGGIFAGGITIGVGVAAVPEIATAIGLSGTGALNTLSKTDPQYWLQKITTPAKGLIDKIARLPVSLKNVPQSLENGALSMKTGLYEEKWITQDPLKIVSRNAEITQESADKASEIMHFATRNMANAQKSVFDFLKPHNALTNAYNGTASCLDSCLVTQQILQNQGVSSSIANLSTGKIPHYAIYLPETQELVINGGRVFSDGIDKTTRILSRLFSMGGGQAFLK